VEIHESNNDETISRSPDISDYIDWIWNANRSFTRDHHFPFVAGEPGIEPRSAFLQKDNRFSFDPDKKKTYTDERYRWCIIPNMFKEDGVYMGPSPYSYLWRNILESN